MLIKAFIKNFISSYLYVIVPMRFRGLTKKESRKAAILAAFFTNFSWFAIIKSRLPSF